MEYEAHKFETLVKERDSSLDKYQQELEKKIRDDSNIKNLELVKILSRANDFNEQFNELKNDADKLARKQEEVNKKIEEEINIACEKIKHLQGKSGMKKEYNPQLGTVLKTKLNK